MSAAPSPRVGPLARSRWVLHLLVIVCLLPVAVPSRGAESRTARAPNFIVILADDLGYADLGHDGSGIETPNIDRLAREGTKLTQFYAAAPYCSPTRAAFLTGRYPHSVGVPHIISSPQPNETPERTANRGRLSHDARTLPQALAPGGYASMLAGKWHLGYEEGWWPRSYGFNRFWGSLAGTPNYFEPVKTYENEQPITVRQYLTDGITEQGVQFIRDHRGQPFFLYLAYNAPHCPREAPPDLVAKYEKVFGEDKAGYAATIDRMDTGIGRVLRTLDDLGLAQNTVVVFTSDNGPCVCQGPIDRPRSAAPLRGHKYMAHEGGIRVPFLARWPGRIPAGRRTDTVASIMDLFPTFLAAAGIRPDPGRPVDGINILPLLEGAVGPVHDDLHWEANHAYGVRRGDWKLVQEGWVAAPYLYNLRADPAEQTDLAARQPEKVKELVGLHEAWRRKYYPHHPPLSKSRPVWWENGAHPGFPKSR